MNQITITTNEYKLFVRAQGTLDIIKNILADEETADYKKVEIINTVIAAMPQAIPFKEEGELY